MDKTVPSSFANRKWLYKKDGPSKIGSWGIWHWNAIPQDDPEKDFIDSTFDDWMSSVEVFVCPGCMTRGELVNRLLTGIPMEVCGAKILFSMQPLDDQYSGLLCSSDQLEVQNGTAKLNPSVFTLPLFHIHIPNTLSISGKIFCRSLTLGLPAEVVRVKDPLALVKEIVLTRVKTHILQQQGLGVNEARRNGEFLRSFLRSVETSTLPGYSDY